MSSTRHEGPEGPGRETTEVPKRYEPPRVETVKILFEEVVLAACKNVGGGGAAVSSCALGCAVDGS